MKSPIKKVYELYKNRAFEKKAREDMIGHAGVHFTWPLVGKSAGAEKAEKAETAKAFWNEVAQGLRCRPSAQRHSGSRSHHAISGDYAAHKYLAYNIAIKDRRGQVCPAR